MHTFKLAVGDDSMMFHIIADHKLLPTLLGNIVHCRINIINKCNHNAELLALREIYIKTIDHPLSYISKPYVSQGLTEEDEIILKLKGIVLTRIANPIRNNVALDSYTTFKRLNISADILREYL